MGLAPESTNGDDNVPGSTRTLTIPTQKGTYQFTEEVMYILPINPLKTYELTSVSM